MGAAEFTFLPPIRFASSLASFLVKTYILANGTPLPKWKGAVFTKISAHLPFICKIIGMHENEGCGAFRYSVDEPYYTYP